jgi:hypothetical protein
MSIIVTTWHETAIWLCKDAFILADRMTGAEWTSSVLTGLAFFVVASFAEGSMLDTINAAETLLSEVRGFTPLTPVVKGMLNGTALECLPVHISWIVKEGKEAHSLNGTK